MIKNTTGGLRFVVRDDKYILQQHFEVINGDDWKLEWEDVPVELEED